MKRLERIKQRLGFDYIPPGIRRLLVAIIGTTIVVIGLLLVFLPGPGALFIFIGLGLLATEFVWARRVVRRGRVAVGKLGRTVRRAVE